MLARLDEFLMNRIFQPTADALNEMATPAEAACFCLIGAMVFVLAGMLASSAVALPDWTVLLDLASLWAGMAALRALSSISTRHLKAFGDQFGSARRILAVASVVLWATGATSIVETFSAMRCTLWCMALYFASCDPPSRFRLGAAWQ